MEKSFLLRRLVFFSVLFLICFPVIYLTLHLEFTSFRVDPFLWLVLEGALVQSAFSLILTLGFGFFAFIGLNYWRGQTEPTLLPWIYVVALVPAILPPIVVVSLGSQAIGHLFVGLKGVVFFHCLMNVGLVAVILDRALKQKLSRWVEFAILSGVSPLKLAGRGILRELRPDIVLLSFYLFVLYFFSFTVPFLVGGSRYGGLEVFLYEKVLFHGQWAEAIQYSCLFILILLVASRFLKKPPTPERVKDELVSLHVYRYMGHWIPAVLLVLPTAFLLFGFLRLWFSHDFALYQFIPDPWSFLGTVVLSMLSGAFMFVLLSVVTFCYVNESLSRWLLALFHPGWVVVGFAFLLLGGGGAVVALVKTAMALTLIYLPFMFRLSFAQSLRELKGQVDVASTFSVSWWKIYTHVIWPQCLPAIVLLSGLTALWASGDFAISGMLFSNTQFSTLAIDMQNLLGSYRFAGAMQLLPSLLSSGFVVFALFQGITYVSRR